MAMTFMSSMRIAMIPVIITMVFRVITVIIPMLISMVFTVIVPMLFRVIAVIIAMLFPMLVSMAAMTSLLNVHTTIKMLCLSPHQGGTNLCFDRETSLVG
jgi:hypothetical protein